MRTEFTELLAEYDKPFANRIEALADRWFAGTHNDNTRDADRHNLWAASGVREILYADGDSRVGSRVAYRSEAMLGVNISKREIVVLWDGADIAYIVRLLVYGPTDKYERKIWSLCSSKTQYKACINTYADSYVVILSKLLPKIKERLYSDIELTQAMSKTWEKSAMVKAKDSISIYAEFAPSLNNCRVDTTKSITQAVTDLYNLLKGMNTYKKYWVALFTKESSGEVYYCFKACERLIKSGQLHDIVMESPAYIKAYGKGAFFSESLKAPLDKSPMISRIRRAEYYAQEAVRTRKVLEIPVDDDEEMSGDDTML